MMFDTTIFTGTNKPGWEPDCGGFLPPARIVLFGNHTYLFDDVLSGEDCGSLISQFNRQEAYPVGIDGYSDDIERVGSHRAMAWAVNLAAKMAPAFEAMPETLTTQDLPSPQPIPEHSFLRLGSTPWLRFMRYKSGGMHVPHYDAAFECPTENYITLFSWVLYLNDVAEEDGGSFSFVDDRGQPNEARDRTDWRRMAHPDEILRRVQPRQGRLLVFPHWLCHQVDAYTGPAHRYIIRGDLAYGVTS